MTKRQAFCFFQVGNSQSRQVKGRVYIHVEHVLVVAPLLRFDCAVEEYARVVHEHVDAAELASDGSNQLLPFVTCSGIGVACIFVE